MIRIILGLCLLASSFDAPAEVYRWRDADGAVHYSDRKPDDAKVEEVAVDEHVPRAPIGKVAVSSASPDEAASAAAPAPARNPISVVMYSSPTCGWCRKAERFFAGRGVPWQSIDITASKQADREFKALGGRGTPLIFIEGERIAGFQQARLDGLLTRYGW